MYQENQYQEEYDDIHVQSGVRAENDASENDDSDVDTDGVRRVEIEAAERVQVRAVQLR